MFIHLRRKKLCWTLTYRSTCHTLGLTCCRCRKEWVIVWSFPFVSAQSNQKQLRYLNWRQSLVTVFLDLGLQRELLLVPFDFRQKMGTTQTITPGRGSVNGRWSRSPVWSWRRCLVLVSRASRIWATTATWAQYCKSSSASQTSRGCEYWMMYFKSFFKITVVRYNI